VRKTSIEESGALGQFDGYVVVVVASGSLHIENRVSLYADQLSRDF